MSLQASLKIWAGKLKRHTLTVYFVARDPRTPFFARLLALLIAGYALSPVDLIPDFIPIVGYLDDLLIVPLGIALVVRFTPPEVIESSREKAAQVAVRPVSFAAAVLIVFLWLMLLLVLIKWTLNVASI